MYTRPVDPVEGPTTRDPVIEAYKKDVDRTLFERNLQLTPSERVEQLQRFVAFLAQARAAKERQVRGERQTD
jgi:hypothetical protein